MKSVLLSCGVLSLYAACGSSDGTTLTAEEAQEAYGCTVIPGPEGSGESVLRCGDGTSVNISDGEGGQDGSPGSDGEDGQDGLMGQDGDAGSPGARGMDGLSGMDGTSCAVEDRMDGTYLLRCEDGSEVIISDGAQGEQGESGSEGLAGTDGNSVVVTERAEPAGPNCVEGGTAIDLTVEGDVTPSSTLYDCDNSAAGCPAGMEFDTSMDRCLYVAHIRYEGVLRLANTPEYFPQGLSPASGLVTETENPAAPSPCAGSLRYPLYRPADTGDGSRRFRFGTSMLFGMTMEVGGITYERHPAYTMPNDAIMMRTEGSGGMSTLMRVEEVDGADPTLYFTEFNLFVNQPYDYERFEWNLPEQLFSWTDTLLDPVQSPTINLRVTDQSAPLEGSLSCRITSFDFAP